MKKRRKLIWRLYPSYLFIILVSLFAVTGYTYYSFQNFFISSTVENLDNLNQMLKEQFINALQGSNPGEVDRLCKEMAAAVPTRLTVILPDGRVVGDSEESPLKMDNHGSRPEIIRSMNGELGVSIRYSTTLRKRMMYVAIPLNEKPKIAGVIRSSLPLSAIDDELRFFLIRVIYGGLLIAVFASGICYLVSRKISRPIEELRIGAERFAEGDLEHKLIAPRTREIANLAEAMNIMAERLENRINSEINQRNETEAILTSMTEGVIALDLNQKIMKMNKVAATLLNCSEEIAKGRVIHEVVRNRDLHDFANETTYKGKTTSGDIVLHGINELTLSVNSVPLKDFRAKRIGSLLVLNDVTRIRRMEKIRSDFVSNVSHEIKTPLTAMKGFVEILKDGALNDPEDSGKFLKIIENHTDRLAAIIENLLFLSKIEQNTDGMKMEMGVASVNQIVSSAMDTCRPEALEKNVVLEMEKEDPECLAIINGSLLEQAVVNLVNNGVKYNRENGIVSIRVLRSGTEIVIRVADTGIGISKMHLDRVFERFYRVDKSRNRKLGGTGLGLAIVKHIVRIHGGKVTVESTPGMGSTFEIHLPAVSGEA